MNSSKSMARPCHLRWILLGAAALVLSCSGSGDSSVPTDTADTPDAEAACVPGAIRCAPDGAAVQVCTGSGDWLDDEVCPDGVPCIQGTCACPPCSIVMGGGCLPVGVQDCAEGWSPTETCGCEPILGDCADGELSLIGGGCHPMLAPCPEGWKPGAEGGFEPILDVCTEGAVPLFGGGCRMTGPKSDCGDAPWGDAADLAAPGQTIRYVLAGWGGGGSDGSASKPFGLISEALEVAEAGDLIVLGAGDGGTVYPEAVTIFHDSLTIAGRCPELVGLTGQQSVTSELSAAISVEYADDFTLTGVTVSGPGGGVLLLNGGNHSLQDMIVSGNGEDGVMLIDVDGVELNRVALSENGATDFGPGLSAWSSSGLVITDSHIAGNAPIGVYMKETEARFQTSLVEESVGIPGMPGGGYGFNTHAQSTLVLEDCGVRFNEDTEVLVGEASSVQMLRCWVGDAGYQAANDSQPGLTLQDGATATVVESVFYGNVVAGISVDDSVAQITRTLVTGTRGLGQTATGRGVQIQNTESPTVLQDSYLVANFGAGIIVSNAAAELHGCVVAGTRGNEFDMDGRGMGLEMGAQVLADSTLFADNLEAAIIVLQSDLELERCWIRDTTPEDPLGTSFGGHGIGANGSTITISSSRIEGNTDLGIYLREGELVLTDSVVSGTTINGDETLGEAVEVLDGQVTVDWCAFTGNHSGALLLSGCDVTVQGGLFEGLDSQPEGTAGDAISAIEASSLVLDSVTLRRNYAFGVVVSDGTVAQISKSSLTDTRPDRSGFFGYGILAQSLSDLTLEENLISTCAGAGVEVYNSNAVIAANHIAQISESKGLWLVDGEWVPSDTPFGDGILVTHEATVDIHDNLVEETQRAGILLDSSAGAVTGNRVRTAKFGLVIQDSEVEQKGNSFEDCETDLGVDLSEGLALPGGPADVPDPVGVNY